MSYELWVFLLLEWNIQKKFSVYNINDSIQMNKKIFLVDFFNWKFETLFLSELFAKKTSKAKSFWEKETLILIFSINWILFDLNIFNSKKSNKTLFWFTLVIIIKIANQFILIFITWEKFLLLSMLSQQGSITISLPFTNSDLCIFSKKVFQKFGKIKVLLYYYHWGSWFYE